MLTSDECRNMLPFRRTLTRAIPITSKPAYHTLLKQQLPSFIGKLPRCHDFWGVGAGCLYLHGEEEDPLWVQGSWVPQAGPVSKAMVSWSCSALTLPKNSCFLKKINTAQLPALPLCSKSSWTSPQEKNWDCSFYFLKGALSTWIEEPSLGVPSELTPLNTPQ